MKWSVFLTRGCPKRRPRILTAWAWVTAVPLWAVNTVGASGGSGGKMLELSGLCHEHTQRRSGPDHFGDLAYDLAYPYWARPCVPVPKGWGEG